MKKMAVVREGIGVLRYGEPEAEMERKRELDQHWILGLGGMGRVKS